MHLVHCSEKVSQTESLPKQVRSGCPCTSPASPTPDTLENTSKTPQTESPQEHGHYQEEWESPQIRRDMGKGKRETGSNINEETSASLQNEQKVQTENLELNNKIEYLNSRMNAAEERISELKMTIQEHN